MRERDAHELITNLMHDHGLADLGWYYTLSDHKSAGGFCQFEDKILGFSLPVIKLNKKKVIREIILHEIAHALAGDKAGHGKIWKQYCKKLGCKAETFLGKEVVFPRKKYYSVCSGCSLRYERDRLTKNAKYLCGKCKTELVFYKYGEGMNYIIRKRIDFKNDRFYAGIDKDLNTQWVDHRDLAAKIMVEAIPQTIQSILEPPATLFEIIAVT